MGEIGKNGAKKAKGQGLVLQVLLLCVYAFVGSLVLSGLRMLLGDPLAHVMEVTESGSLMAFALFSSLVTKSLVGFVALKALKKLLLSLEKDETAEKLAKCRVLDPMWEADCLVCSEIMRKGSKSFFLAAWLLPEWVRDPALALYSFCRKADDDVDEGNPETAPDRLKRLYARLDDAYKGVPQDSPVDRAFSATVRAFDIPREFPLALLDGFEWDLDKKKYKTLSDTVAYSARVASAVGGMMTVLMGGDSARTYARAFDLGVALQLTNIARDVGEDARNGRVYLPADWLAEEGIDSEAFMKDPKFSPALGRVVARLLAEADRYYVRADSGISMLPRSCRVAIRAARLIYCEIGDKLRRKGLNSVSKRTVVSKRTKIMLALQAIPDYFIDREPNDEPVAEECRYLLDAVMPLCVEGRAKVVDGTDMV